MWPHWDALGCGLDGVFTVMILGQRIGKVPFNLSLAAYSNVV
jgi:hypothetical protein